MLLSVEVLSYHNDAASTGQNLNETLLTPTSITNTTANPNNFGKRYSTAVDGQVYAQPLYVSQLNVTGGSSAGVHNVVFVATENDSLYAVDADSGSVLYHDSFISVAQGITTVPNGDVNTGDISPQIGITSTPVIDRAAGYLFLAAKTKQIVSGNTSSPHYVYTLYRVNIADGTYTSAVIGNTTYTSSSGAYVYNSGPYVVGSGDGAISVGGQSRVYFNALRELNRPALTLYNNNVYIAFGSHGDNGPYHGWILGYNESSLSNSAAFNTSPNGGLDGIWQAGGTIAMDPQGYMYLETGNGTFDTTLNAQGFPAQGDYGDSFIKIGLDLTSTQANQNGNINGFGLKVVDYFTPFNQAGLSSADKDLGSGAPMVLPDSPGAKQLLVGSGKEGKVYLIDRNSMGKYDPSTDHVVEEMAGAINGSLDTPALFNDGTTTRLYYVGGYGDSAKAFSIANGMINPTPSSVSPDSFAFPGSTPSISANGANNGIVWDIDRGTNQLRAYSASNYGTELWTSGQAANNRDQLGGVVKFTVPTVVNGHVFVGTSSALVAYGPPQPPNTVPATPTLLTATVASAVQVNLAWLDHANNEDGYYVEQSNDSGQSWTQIATLGVNAQSYLVTKLTAGTSYTFRVRAFNALGQSAYSNLISATTSTAVPALDFSSGFAGASGLLTPNGVAVLNGVNLQLTSAVPNQAGSAFSKSAFSDQRFITTFTFQFVNPNADGMTFTLQNAGPTALGATGQNLGFAGINNSVAIKFDLYNNAGEGADSTGLYVNGAIPTINGNTYDMTSSGVDLHSGDSMQATLAYDGATLTETVLDTVTNKTFSQTYAINIPATIGSNTAYVGFTGATGGQTAIQNVTSWTYTPLPTAAPAVPKNLTVTPASGTQLNLAWTETSTQGVDGFKIYRQIGGSGSYTFVTEVAGNQLSFMDTALNPNTIYAYEIAASNSFADSANSTPMSALTPIPPTTPSMARTTFIGITEIDLAWVDTSTNEQGIKIYRKKTTDGANQFAQAASLPPGSTSFQDTGGTTGLLPGTSYDYHIQAYNLAGYSDFAGITVNTLAAAPTGLTPQASSGQIALSWQPSVGATAYNVYRSTTPGGEGSTPYGPNVSGTSFNDLSVTSGTTYYYEVSAIDPSGEGPLSSEISVRNSSGPSVSAGANQTITFPFAASLSGSVTESNLPQGQTLSSTWTKVSGPGAVTFNNAASPTTTAAFAAPGAYVLQLTGSDGVSSNSAQVSITVNPDSGPAVSAGSNQTVNLGSSANLSGSVTESPLAPGLTLSSTWSRISGPGTVSFANANSNSTTAGFTAAGSYVLQLSGTDGITTNSSQVTVTVNPVVSYPGTPFPGPGAAVIPGTIQAENFDNGGQGVAYNWQTTTNPGGANYRPGAGVGIQTTNDTGGGNNICYVVAGDWLKYSVNVQTAGAYSLDVRVSQKAAGGQIHLEVDGINVTGTVNIPNTGSWNTWQTITVTGINLSAGSHVVRLSFDTNAADNPGVPNQQFVTNLNWFRFNLTQAAPQGPTVNAGSNQSVNYPFPVILSGSVTESNPPGALTSTWTQKSGPGTTTFANATSAGTTATFSTPGTYVLQLAGGDGSITNTSSVTITVNPAPAPGPVVSAGANQTVNYPIGVSLAGSVVEPGVTVTSTWSQIGGAGVATFANQNSAATTATFSTPGTYTLQLAGSDGTNTNKASVQITVNPDPGPTVSAGSNQTITLSSSVALNGSVTESPLASGLTLSSTWTQASGPGTASFANPNGAVTTASFSQVGTYVLKLTGTDAITANSSTVTITVNPVVTYAGTPFPGPNPAPVPGTIQAENFDTGGEGVAYHWQTSTNPGGVNYRPGAGVGVQTTTDAGGGDNICYAVAGDWLKYTVNVATTRAYTLNLRVAQKAAGGQMHVEVDGINVSGTISIPNTGNWQTWQTIALSGINLTAGNHVVKVSFDTNANDNPGVANAQFVANFNWLQFV